MLLILTVVRLMRSGFGFEDHANDWRKSARYNDGNAIRRFGRPKDSDDFARQHQHTAGPLLPTLENNAVPLC